MKTILTSVLAITIAFPAFADITGSSNCTEGVLGTSTNGSTANIDANWNPNTIYIKWYNGDTQLTQTSCQYDTTIVLPTEPTKPGYTFAGWQLRTASAHHAIDPVVPEVPEVLQCWEITNYTECNNTDGCILDGSRCKKHFIVLDDNPSCSSITNEAGCNGTAYGLSSDSIRWNCYWFSNTCNAVDTGDNSSN